MSESPQYPSSITSDADTQHSQEGSAQTPEALTPQQKFSRSLRALADWYEQHPTVATPSSIKVKFSVTRFSAKPEEIRAIGPGKKSYDDTFFTYTVGEDKGFELEFMEYRNLVCTRKVVGKKHVPELLIPSHFVPEHEEDVVEWECPGSLLSPEEEAVRS